MIDAGTLLQERYEVTRLLAHGGMGDVYLARDRTLDRNVAIKVVRGATPDQRGRFEREARLLARFEHPNLVRIFDAQHSENEAYAVLEYVDGPTLAEALRSGPMEPASVARVGADVADALAYIHGRGVIHRDVKPSNIFLGNDGRVRLSDFGIARSADDAQLTQTGMVIGTGAYMAPEQVSGDVVGPPADVYALGLVLLECLRGAQVFSGPASEAAVARLARDPNVSDLPAGWAALLGAMTARDPSIRPDAAWAAARLQPLESGDAGSSTQVLPAAPTVVTPAPAPLASAPRSHKLRTGIVAALVTLLVGLLVLLAFARGGDSPSSDTTTTTTSTTVASTTTTTAKPTTTTSPCDALQAQRDALDQQAKTLDDTLKGRALHDAQKQLDDQKKALDNELKQSC